MLNQLQDVFRFFQQHEVKYVVIGGIASVLHGIPRATFDLDILIEATAENAQRLLAALESAGLGTATMTNAEDISIASTMRRARLADVTADRMRPERRSALPLMAKRWTTTP